MLSRIIEYFYLAGGVALAATFSVTYKFASLGQSIALIVGALLFTAMYSYRKTLRKKLSQDKNDNPTPNDPK